MNGSDILKACARMALKSGLLDPFLKGVAEASARSLTRLTSLIDCVEAIYRARKRRGDDVGDFQTFFRHYIATEFAEVVRSNPVCTPDVVQAAATLLQACAKADSRFWADTIKSPGGFPATKVGSTFVSLADELVKVGRPVVLDLVMRVRADYEAATKVPV